MSTAGDIITYAFREGNFIAVGETPTAAEIAEALPRLQNLLASLFGNELGENYRDWYVTSQLAEQVPLRTRLAPTTDPTVSPSESWKYPPPNARLLVKITAAQTVILPANPNDGARIMVVNVGSTGSINLTLDANGHLIDTATSLTGTLTTLTGKWWLYRADLGQWTMFVPIAEDDDDMPLPEEFDDYFICGLAIRLSTRYQT